MIQSKTIAHPLTATGIATVKELQALRGRLQLTDAAFFRERLLPFMGSDPTKWTKLQKNVDQGGNYTGRTADLEPKLAEALSALKEHLRYDEVKSRASALPFRETSLARKLFKAVDELREETDECRVIILLLNPGCGKSAILREVLKRYGGWKAQCTSGWYYGYGTCLKDTARAMGIIGPYATRNEWWNAMKLEVTKHPGVLAYDDFNTVGAAAVNMVRDINSATQERGGVQICAAIPEFYARMKSKSFFEAQQVVQRSMIIERGCDKAGVPLPNVLPGDVELFLQPHHFAGQRPALVHRLAEACNHFGNLRLVTRVLKLLPQSTAERPISDKAFEEALLDAKNLVAREFGGGR